MWVFLLLCSLLGGVVYVLLASRYGYWKKRGVPHPPVSLIFGNLKKVVFVKESMGQLYTKIYNDYPDLLYVGFYKIRTPAIVVRDADLLQTIMIKEFNSFHDNDLVINEKIDPIFSKNPLVQKGDKWKNSRNKLTPSFTSKKLKSMFPLIEEVSKRMVAYINQNSDACGEEGLESKELAAKFTTDSVATCAFGIEAHAFDDPHSEFREIGRKLLTPSLSLALRHLCVMLVPSLADIVKAKFVPDEVADYFRTVTREMLRYREENNIIRGDFLDIMKEFRNKLGDEEFGYEDIAAHAGGFYADGYETSSLMMSFTLLELAMNLDVQAKLREEIDNNLQNNGGKFNYEELMENTYLENVLYESLRKHPPAYFLARLCTKPFTLPSPFGEGKGPDVTLEPGTPVLIPTYGIHYDPQYYPDPEKFDPDRFAEGNRDSRNKCTFLGFGGGPRQCLGMRFALSQVKIALAHIILNFDIRLNKKTIVPLEIDPKYFLLKVKGDIWLNYYKRK